jgi:predicted O-linked N-acetylglucosamine transferase (SPINDLY family)
MLLKLLRACFQPGAGRMIQRGLALRQQGDLKAAEQFLREAAAKFPRDAVAAINLALVLLEQNHAAAGAAELERALALDPANGTAHYNYANLLRNSGRHADALRHYAQAAEAQPPVTLARQELMFALLEVCAWDDAEREAALLRELCAAPGDGWLNAIAPLTATYLELDDTSCKRVAAWHAAQAARGAAPARQTAVADGKRLRIGYISPDFREHPVGHLMRAGLALHDRGRFELFAYSAGYDDNSDCRRGIAASVDHFVDIAALSDAAAANRIAADGVQVLIDLAGHTTGGRLGVLARRPAPVQAHYLGYAATTGAAYIDYFISDAIATPPELADAFTEKIAYVPGCFMLSGGAPAAVAELPTRTSQGLPENATVFSSFANASRITREVFGLWLNILRAVPGSVLWLRQSDPAVVDNLRTAAQLGAIDPARLVFAARVPDKARHMARLALADLSLDTIGWHNGHSTTNELLWAGVPVLTAPGRTFAARVGASLVSAAGLPELVARDQRDYVEIAIRLGRERVLCDALKCKIADNRNHALFFDGRRILAGLEAVLLEMWRQQRNGEPPRPIDTRRLAAARNHIEGRQAQVWSS